MDMHSNVLFVSAYTKDTPYETEIGNLRASLDKFRLPYEFYPLDSLGDWLDNCKQKTKVVSLALNKSERNIVWIDADAEIISCPYDLLGAKILEYDFAYHYRDLKNGNFRLSSNLVFFKNTSFVKRIVNIWQREVYEIQNKTVWEGDTLLKLIRAEHGSVFNLPKAYSKIFDDDDVSCVPIIKQNQASRRFKKIYDNK